MKTDLLAFGAHPDDVELGAGGLIALTVHEGKTVGIIDLTRGELGTRGNADLRDQEAEASGKVLGIHFRANLGFKDGFIQNDEHHQLQIIRQIRKYRPEIVIANAVRDRHTDHGKASALVSDACFLSGLNKIITLYEGSQQEAWRPKAVYHYIQDRYIEPDFVIDVSRFLSVKMEAIQSFSSQFYNPDSNEPETAISSKAFMDIVKGRLMDFGRPAGFEYAEGFTVERTIGVSSIFNID